MPRVTEKWLPAMARFPRRRRRLFGATREVESDQESSEGDEIPDWARRPTRSPSWNPGEAEQMPATQSLTLQPRRPGGLARPSSRESRAARATAVAAHGSAAPMEEQVQRLHELCRLQEGQIAQLRSDLTALQPQAEASRAELEGVCGLRADVAEMRAVGGLLDHCKEEDERRRERFERLYARAEEQVRQLQARVKELAPLPAQTEDQVQQLEVRVQATCETADLDLGSRQEERWRPRASRFAGSTALEHQDAPGQRSADSSPAPVGATAPPAEGFLLPPGALMARCSARDLPAGHQPQRSPRPPPKMQA